MSGHVASANPVENACCFHSKRRRDEVRWLFTNGLALGIAENPLRGRIPADDRKVSVKQNVNKWHPLDVELQTGEQCVPLCREPSFLCDFAGDANDSDDVPSLIPVGRLGSEEGPVYACDR